MRYVSSIFDVRFFGGLFWAIRDRGLFKTTAVEEFRVGIYTSGNQSSSAMFNFGLFDSLVCCCWLEINICWVGGFGTYCGGGVDG